MLRDDLILVIAGPEIPMDACERMRHALKDVEAEYGVRGIVFGGVDRLADFRLAPPPVIEAAQIMQDWADNQ